MSPSGRTLCISSLLVSSGCGSNAIQEYVVCVGGNVSLGESSHRYKYYLVLHSFFTNRTVRNRYRHTYMQEFMLKMYLRPV